MPPAPFVSVNRVSTVLYFKINNQPNQKTIEFEALEQVHSCKKEKHFNTKDISYATISGIEKLMDQF